LFLSDFTCPETQRFKLPELYATCIPQTSENLQRKEIEEFLDLSM
jgi:hypothetical protein